MTRGLAGLLYCSSSTSRSDRGLDKEGEGEGKGSLYTGRSIRTEPYFCDSFFD
jgi:hypothetical protein